MRCFTIGGFDRPGVYEITVMDEAGGYDRITVEVIG